MLHLPMTFIILKALFNLERHLWSCGSDHGSFPYCYVLKYSRFQKKVVISEHQSQNHEGQKRCSSYAITIKRSSFLHHYVNKKEGEKKKKRDIGKAFERISERARRESKENQAASSKGCNDTCVDISY